MSKSEFKIAKLVKTWGQVFFYSVCSYILAICLEIVYFDRNDLVQTILPITSNQYWYFSAYIVVFIFSPIINLMFEKFDKKKIVFILIAAGYFFSIMPTFGYFQTTSNDRIGVMFVLYGIGAFVRKYYSEKNKKCLYVEIGISIILFAAYSCFAIFYDNFHSLPSFLNSRFCMVWGIEKISIILFSLIVFLVFKNIDLRYSRVINWIAASTFGVYLLHMNNWTTGYIWSNLCRTRDYYTSKYMILHAMICCGLIFIVCVAIDKIRMYMVEKPVEKSIMLIKENKSKMVLAFYFVLVVVVVINVYRMRLVAVYDGGLQWEDNCEAVELDKNTTLEENFYNEEKLYLKRISFHTITWNKSYEEGQQLYVSIKDEKSKEVIYNNIISLSSLADQGNYELSVMEDVILQAGHWYKLEFSSNTLDEQEKVAIMLTDQVNNGSKLYMNGREMNQHVGAKIFGKRR